MGCLNSTQKERRENTNTESKQDDSIEITIPNRNQQTTTLPIDETSSSQHLTNTNHINLNNTITPPLQNEYDKVNVTETNHCNGQLMECQSANRIKCILINYHEMQSIKKTQKEQKLQIEANKILHDISPNGAYSNIEISADFHHIKFDHHVSDDMNQFDTFYKYLSDKDDILNCDINHCQAIKTYYDRRHRIFNDKPRSDDLKHNDRDELYSMNLICQIHAYFIHLYDPRQLTLAEIQCIEKQLNEYKEDDKDTKCNKKLELIAKIINDKKQNSRDYKEIRKNAQNELDQVLRVKKDENSNNDTTIKQYKTTNDLLAECTNCIATDKNLDVFTHCESIKRITIVLIVYKELMKFDNLWRKVSLAPILTFQDIYTLIQINDDFYHIKDHMDDNDKLEHELRTAFKTQFECTELKKCYGYDRMRYRLKFTYPNNMKTEDIVFQGDCDKIHSYLIHGQFDNPIDIMRENENKNNKNEDQDKKQNDKGYVGRKEDEAWWNYNDDIKDDDDEMETEQEDEHIYRQLVDNMGIFRWQSCHGFTSTHYEGLMHLKPKYKNIKDEALHNPYYTLSTDNWNQTLRKATVFFKSFARQKIKTVYNGRYNDKITGRKKVWTTGEDIDMKEIVTLKLYTDFDKLQYELKKCFRFEIISDIFTLKNFDPNCMDKDKYAFDPKAKELRFKLEERLQIFYWWRVDLIAVLNKFGKEFNHKKIALYHGVNAKMILNNGGTQMLRFYGPLSTSASYHVARTFATAKGMVLSVTTQYPHLGICRAFDASNISDYPEEKEWLIGFVYLRILKVLTRPLNKRWKTFDDIDNKNSRYYQIPLSSETRSIFFAIHLFRQQVFSMSVHLEYWLSSFLYLQCKYNEKNNNNDNGHIQQTKFAQKIQEIVLNKNNKDENMENDEKEQMKHDKILNILWRKCDNFRRFPNQNQVVRIDEISDNLKPYFMDYDGLDIRKNEKYIISFTKIVRIFENIKEIHLINSYIFDNVVLNKVLQCLDENGYNDKLEKIKFLYYDYQQQSTEANNIVFDAEKCDKTLLNRLKEKKWNIKHKHIGKIGYQIKIFSS